MNSLHPHRSCAGGLAALLAASLFAASASAQTGFDDASSRLSFVHGGGLGGAAWLDYDADGDLDLFVPNGAAGMQNGLFRNNGDGTFADVTVAAGVQGGQGSSAVVAGDIDNDGYPDLFLSGSGGMMGSSQSPTTLYHNRGDGTFADITATARVPGSQTAFSAAFGDIDNDGFLDLFVTAPGSLQAQVQHRNKLYRNNGDLTFTDISATARVHTSLGACAASITDINGDGLQDILVANCNDVRIQPTPFELFLNNGNLTFLNVAQGVGLTRRGFWRSTSLGDIDNDGDLDLFSTNVGPSANEPHALYRQNGDGTYTDVGASAGVAGWEFGWGSTFADFDNDGDLDLFFTGSLPPPPFNIIGPGLGNPGRLFLNRGDGTFTHAAGAVPVDMSSDFTSGVAHGDFDGDGFPDVLVVRDTYGGRSGRPVLLRARPNGNNWVTVRLVGTASNRGGVGAKIELWSADLHTARIVQAGSSVASSETPWPTFGLGSRTRPMVRVSWPSGRVELFANLAIRQTVTLVEGQGGYPAAYTEYGSGCPGTAGVPHLFAAPNQLPWINYFFTAIIQNLPVTAPVAMNVGISDRVWGPLTLPFDLTPFGGTGCTLLASAEYWVPLGNFGGNSLWGLTLGDDPTLIGLKFYNQVLVFDPGANPAGVTLSNGAAATIGSL